MPRSLQFSETMQGHLQATQQLSFPIAQAEYTEQGDIDCDFTVEISIDNIDDFINDPQLCAHLSGNLQIANNTYLISQGIFNLFTSPSASDQLATRKEMHYQFFFTDEQKRPCTFFGYKALTRENSDDLWRETTTLYSSVWEGHISFTDSAEKKIIYQGILKISLPNFIALIKSIHTSASNPAAKISTISKFLTSFSENLWEAYAPDIFFPERYRWNDHPVPLRSTAGVHCAQKTTVSFNTPDGIYLELQRFTNSPTKDVVLLLHGLTISTDMFIMPEHYNITQYLLDHNFSDIWSLDWRGSGYFTYNMEPHRFTIDHMATYDVPNAITQIKKMVGEDVRIHVIAHCFGSLSFMTSLAAGLTSNIASVISSSVSLTPKVRWQTYLKLIFAPNLVEYLLGYPYLSPKMPYYPGPGFGRWLYWLVQLFHRECKEPSCHMMSFMWGYGFPAAYEHRNLSPITHRRLGDLFGGTSMHYYRHILKMLRAKEAIPYSHKGPFHHLPKSYLANMQNIDVPPILFISGSLNHIFPQSNYTTYQRLLEQNKDYPISYQEFPGYGHQDVFMGKHAAQDVFPRLLQFLEQHRGL